MCPPNTPDEADGVETSEGSESPEASGVVGPGEVDYPDDAIVVDLTEDKESQNWLDSVPEETVFTDLSDREKEQLKRDLRDTLDQID